MRHLNAKDCEVGHIVLTGDQYGMDTCVCINSYGPSHEELPFNVVRFLDLTSGCIHETGGVDDKYFDECYLLSKITPAQTELIKKQWLLTS